MAATGKHASVIIIFQVPLLSLSFGRLKIIRFEPSAISLFQILFSEKLQSFEKAACSKQKKRLGGSCIQKVFTETEFKKNCGQVS